jgi:uncharacterized protein (TIGR00266 family)
MSFFAEKGFLRDTQGHTEHLTTADPVYIITVAAWRGGLNYRTKNKGVVLMKYEIEGAPMPVVICTLENGEQMMTERGSMSWMSPNMKMETTTGGGLGKALGRMFAGEAMFQNRYPAVGGQGMIAFASSFPGDIKAFEIAPGREMVVQKSGFLASETSVTLSVFFQKKFASGLFGGEGFIMQRLSGSGTAFCEFDGHIKEYQLAAGQAIVVDTGYLAAMDATCSLEIQAVPGAKNLLFGGEGIFNTVVKGPGRIYLQTMPVSGVASALIPYLPTQNS